MKALKTLLPRGPLDLGVHLGSSPFGQHSENQSILCSRQKYHTGVTCRVARGHVSRRKVAGDKTQRPNIQGTKRPGQLNSG